MLPVIFLNSYLIAVNFGYIGHVACLACIRLSNTSRHGLVVDHDASSARGLIPDFTFPQFVPLYWLLNLMLIDAPGDKTGALALEICPFIDWSTLALVRIIVGHGAGDLAATVFALLGHVAARTGFNVVVSDIAAIRSFVPDGVAVDACA